MLIAHGLGRLSLCLIGMIGGEIFPCMGRSGALGRGVDCGTWIWSLTFRMNIKGSNFRITGSGKKQKDRK